MPIPLVDLKAQYASIRSEIDAAVKRVIDAQEFIQGKEVLGLEQEFAAYVGSKHCVGVGSGTAALQLALLGLGVGPGDEVLTTTFTFMATAEAISQTGARPVLVDVDPATGNLDPALVEKALTPKTRGIMPVHLYGQPAALGPLLEIAQRRGLWLLEDAAQAHGSEWRGRRIGSIGRIAGFSFFPGKNLGAYGDAGAITGNDDELMATVRRLRDHGRTTKYEHELIGWGHRLDALQAAILRAKLAHLEAWTEARRAHAAAYDRLLAGSGVEPLGQQDGVRHVYHLYVVRCARRDHVIAALKEKGIAAGIHYPIPLHRQPAYAKQGYGDLRLPVAEKLAAEVLSLPLYPEMTSAQVEEVAGAVREALR